MLEAAGASITRRENSVTVRPAERLELGEIEVPGDFSSAAPFIVAATLVPGSELHIHGVNLNPRRTGLLTILERMGGRVTVYNRRARSAASGRATSRCARRSSSRRPSSRPRCRSRSTSCRSSPSLASCAHGTSRLRGAEELRAKESDRVEATVDALRALGQHVEATEDGFRIRGVPTRPRGGRIRSRGDHRMAMLGAVAALDSQEGVEIEDAECVDVSFPGFFDAARLAPWGGGGMIVAIDGPAGAGKSSVARALAAPARLPLPRHGCDVPRAHLARAAQRGRPRRRARARRTWRASTRSSSATGSGVFIAGHDVTAEIRSPVIDSSVPIVARHHEVREVMRERQRQLGEQGDSVIEGPRHRRGRGAARRAQGLAVRRPRGAGRAPPCGAGRDRGRGRSPTRCGAETSATPPTRTAPTTRSRSTRPTSSLEQVIDRIEALVQERVA